MKVSVIIPTYNREAVLKDPVESVLSQTYKDLELVVVDDCSTDGTLKYLESIKDPRLKIISLKENRGVCAARNAGIKESGGDLIAYLDSDNIWHGNYLEVMVAEMTEDIVLAYSGQNTLLVHRAADGELKVLGRKVRNHRYNPAELMSGNYIDINCVIHRKNLFEEFSMFDESLKSLEDWDLVARVAAKYPFRIRHVDQVLGDYRFFTRDTLTTATNTAWEKWVLDDFGLGEKEPDEVRILDKLPQTPKV